MALSPDDWSERLARVRRHDEAAAHEMVEQLYPLVVRIVRAHRPSRMPEEDLCQEVFLRILASLDQFRGKVPFEHWVSRLAVNTCIDHLRRQRSRPELRWADLDPGETGVMEWLAAAESSPSTESSFAARELVDRLMETLDPKDRLLIRWLELEDLTVRDISERTGWSPTLVKVRAFRARHRLRKALETLRKQSPHES